MICKLHIKNYALISTLEIDFEHGFSVITGETGAGKSILLGALSLLLGQRADAKTIRQGEKKCIIEALFSLSNGSLASFFQENDLDYDNGYCLLRREIQNNGKSRAFVNDTPVSLALLKQLSSLLIDIHSQHRNFFLSDTSFQLRVVDIVARHSELLQTYAEHYQAYKQAQQTLAQLQALAQKNNEEVDYLSFQYQQLTNADLHSGEQEELEQEADALTHAEEIKTALYKIDQIMSGESPAVLDGLHDALRSLESVSSYLPKGKEWIDRIESNLIDLKDLSAEIAMHQDDIEYNPKRQEEINERLDLIYTLQKKHHVTDIDQLLDIQAQIGNRLHQNDSLEEEISAQEQQLKERYRQVIDMAQKLSDNRHHIVPQIETQMVETLKQLGMPNIRFSVQISTHQPDPTGIDTLVFLFSANKNAALQPISEIASGGEIARVMLALKALIAGAISLPSIIFDEIDTGVSGEIAGKMARIMQEMGKTMQVITITHLPQIASKGRLHYKVYKEDNEESTVTHIRLLSPEERVNEIAGMLSSGTLSEAALNNARSLLHDETATI